MPKGRKPVVKASPKPISKPVAKKAVSGGSDSIEAIRKKIKEHGSATKLILGKSTFEGIRMDPWFGDNGTTQTLDGIEIEVSKKDRGVEVK